MSNLPIDEEIQCYLNSLTQQKQMDLELISQFIQNTYPDSKRWFLDGKNDTGKVVSNPNIGFGERLNRYADGSQKSFYRVGISANSTGISVYILGLSDKNTLKDRFSATLGKASITGYCIKFKSLEQINFPVLQEAIAFGMNLKGEEI